MILSVTYRTASRSYPYDYPLHVDNFQFIYYPMSTDSIYV